MLINELWDFKFSEFNSGLTYHVTLSFDLNLNDDTGMYGRIDKGLKKLGLLRDGTIAESEQEQGRSHTFDLPSNTFVGVVPKNDTALSWRLYLAEEVQKIFRKYGLDCDIYLSVSENWSVGVHTTGK